MPRRSCRCRAAARADARFTWYAEGDWSGSLSFRQPLRMPLEVGTRPTFYDGGLSLAAGLAVDQRPALEPWIGLDSVRLLGAVPHLALLRQRFTVLPRDGAWSLQSSLAAAVPLRIVPRVYLVPSVDLGADWRLFGVGTAPPAGVESRLRAGAGSGAGGPRGDRARVRRSGPAGPAGRRARGPDPGPAGVPQPHGRALCRSGEPLHGVPGARRRPRMESACGRRAERRHHHADRPAVRDRRRAGRSPAAGRTAGDPSTWRGFLSANLPLRLYTLLLAD